MNMLRRILIAVLALLSAPWLVAQGDPLVEALRKYQAGDLEKARELIDLAVTTPDHIVDPEAWLLRGFVYKDAYKSAVGNQQADSLRGEAIQSLYSCMSLDSVGTYRENAKQAYDYLARSYFNDAAKALNELDDERALVMFEKHKEATLRLDPTADMGQREIEFLNALGTVYTKRFNQDRTDLSWFDKAIAAYEKVLGMDGENYGANYNLATLFYNRGVYNIQRINGDDEIPTILQIQEASREFFQSALPYMLKAHDMNSTRRETLLGLEGIYYSLQDQESSDKFRELFEELPPQEDR
jgi:tetratricopeptide (TPR) repeat protein